MTKGTATLCSKISCACLCVPYVRKNGRKLTLMNSFKENRFFCHDFRMILGFYLFLCLFKTVSHYVDQTGLEFTM
jgi:hypothetical protein